MNTARGIALAAILATAVGGSAHAAETKAPKPIVVEDKVTMKATVEAIDKANRMVTLKGPKGNVLTLPVDESVERFDKIKVGDQITAQYFESVVAEIVRPGAAPAPDNLAGAGGKLPGEKPAGVVAAQATMTVTVEAIDPETPAVTVRTADGNSVSFRVRQKKYLKDVKVGDQVTITKTEALMIAVEEPK